MKQHFQIAIDPTQFFNTQKAADATVFAIGTLAGQEFAFVGLSYMRIWV
jgi:hypothetical protein